MAQTAGRNLIIKRSTDGGTTYNAIASVRSKSVTINNEPIDVTTDDSDAWRTLLAEPGSRSIDITVSGVTDDDTLMTAIMAGTSSVALHDIQVDYNGAFTLTGDFYLNSLTYTGEYTDAVTFEASLQSSGEVVKA